MNSFLFTLFLSFSPSVYVRVLVPENGSNECECGVRIGGWERQERETHTHTHTVSLSHTQGRGTQRETEREGGTRPIAIAIAIPYHTS